MELRHLRYFVAIAEEGSVTLAATRRLHTAQPSLSRQIRDLETEVGAQLLTRNARGVELTPAGRAFLDHARLALAQVEAAGEAARRVTNPAKSSFVLGFLTGQEMQWLPAAMRVLRDDLPAIDVVISSQTSPELAGGLMRGKIDVAVMRRESVADLRYQKLVDEPLVFVLPSDHPLTAKQTLTLKDIAKDTFINVSRTAPTLRNLIDKTIRQEGLDIPTRHEADHLSMAISLVSSTRGIALLPRYALNFLPWSVVSRPMKGEPPTIELVLGYHKDNKSPLLKIFLSHKADLVSRFTETSP
jgi:LysR family hca operon transcriptional activator